MKKTMVAVVMVVASVLAGLGVASVTVGQAQAAELRMGEGLRMAGQDHYFDMNGNVRQARATCYRAGQPDLPGGSTADYVAWYNDLTASEHTHWDAVFTYCVQSNPASYPGDFHEVTRQKFYSNL